MTMLKIGMALVHFVYLMSIVSALNISISPSMEPEYTTSTIPLNVVISESYRNWGYSINNNHNVTVCSYSSSKTVDVSYNNGTLGDSFLLDGDNDIKIEFGSSIVPQIPHQGVKICFYLYDNDPSQENSFLFRVNNGTSYGIPDDQSIPAYQWTWVCRDLNPSDFSNNYTITAWYENRYTGGGLSIANSRATTGSSSYFDSSSNNLPGGNITWIKLAGDSDWMVNLSIITKPQECPLVSSTNLEAILGYNTVNVWANSSNGTAHSSQTFWVVNLTNISLLPRTVLYGHNVNISAKVIADTILSVTASVTMPNGSVNAITMLDDGFHNDGGAGDKIYGIIYNATLPGSYTILIQAVTPFHTFNFSGAFSAISSNFGIISPIDGATLSKSPITFSVILPTNVTEWGISIDNGPNTTICSYSLPVQDVDINFTNGNESGAWNLNGNNEARIVFKKSDLPPGKHKNVTFCFYLYDNDWAQEENFLFQVNGRGIYSIPDNASIVAGEYHWVCKAINSSDFSDSYVVDFWYSNRSTSGGVFIANDNSTPGTSSLYDNSPTNLPMADGASMNWVTYFDSTDWMVQAIVTADEYFCPETYTTMMQINPGFHNVTTYIEKGTETFSQSVKFELIDVQDITIYPRSVKPGNTINIQAHVFASNITKVETIIQPQIGLPITIPMYDDGLHNDWAPLDKVYGINYTPLFANPYNVTIKLTTGDNSTVQKTDYFVASNTRVAIVHSSTTLNSAIPAGSISEMEYMGWITSLQHLFAMAGVPFEVINEDNLKDLNLIRQYDAIALPSFRNVRSTDRNQIIANLETAVKDYGIDILAFGELMSYDENNTLYFDANVPFQKILNIEETGIYGGNTTTSVIVNDNTHPSAWRFKQGEELISYFDDFYVEFKVYDTNEQYAYPYLVIDQSINSTITNVIASTNKKGRAFYCENPDYLIDTAMGRDAILWLLYGYNPHIGVKMTDKTAIFTARVDADVSYDTPQTSLAMQNYLLILGRNNMSAGWYIVTRHSGSAQVQWEQLKDDYWNLLNAGHEIGSHSLTHPNDMNLLSDDAAFNEMYSSKMEIDRELGIDIKGLANPGESPNQTRLWHIAEKAGYQYYSPLDDGLKKGLGFVDDKVKVVSIQQNMMADYDLLVDQNKTIPETIQAWKDQYDNYYRQGDGIVVFAIWHDYYLDEIPELFGSLADYVKATDSQSLTPGQIVDSFVQWRKQDLIINQSGTSFFITRTTPDAKYGQITLPPGSRILRINGGTYRNTTDNKSISFTFDSDTLEIVLDNFLFLEPISNQTLYENQTLEITLSAVYFGTGSLTYGTDAKFGSFNITTGKFLWTPSLNDSGNYIVKFNVTDGIISYERMVLITVLNASLLTDGWVRLARIGGTAIYSEMSDTELKAILDERVSQQVSVVEFDSKLSDYLTDEEFDREVAFLNHSAQLAHERGLRAVIYYPSLEVNTPDGEYINKTMFKDHPDWLQYDINGTPNVFYGSLVYWIDPGMESAWMSPNGPYRDYYINRIRKLAATSLDGIWVDVPIYADIINTWNGAESYAAGAFRNWSISKGLGLPSGLSLPTTEDFNNLAFRAWISWRHENLADYIDAVRQAAQAVNPKIQIVVEDYTIDHMNALTAGLDGMYRRSTNNFMRVWEVDSISNRLAMQWSTTEDFDNLIAMFKWSRGAERETPSWVFSYGNEQLDAGLALGAAVATGNSPFETKVPNMTDSVGADFRSRWFGFIYANEDALLNTSRSAKVGIWYSSATRDYQDYTVGGSVGMYANTDPPTPDPDWWSNASEDSVINKPHLGGWRGAAHGLTQLHIPYKVIGDPGDPRNELKGVSLVWLPSVAAISNESAAILKNFTASGGIVLATGTEPGTLDELGNTRSSSILADLFGFTGSPSGPVNKSYGNGTAFYRPDVTGTDLFGIVGNATKANQSLTIIEQIIRSKVPDTVRVNTTAGVHIEVSELKNKAYLYVLNYQGLKLPAVSDPKSLHIQYSLPKGYKVKSASITTPDINGQSGAINLIKEADPFYGFNVVVDQFALITLELEQESAKVIPLNKGWNLISIPLRLQNNSVTAVFKGINYSSIIGYGYNWTVPSEIDYTKGYWINSIKNQNITLNGTIPVNTLISLNPGWNLIGYPTLNESEGDIVFKDINNSLISVFSYRNGTWFSYSSRNDMLIKPGYGYWVNVDKSVSLVIP